MVHTWKLGLVSRLFLLQECFLTASGPTVYLAVAVHGMVTSVIYLRLKAL